MPTSRMIRIRKRDRSIVLKTRETGINVIGVLEVGLRLIKIQM